MLGDGHDGRDGDDCSKTLCSQRSCRGTDVQRSGKVDFKRGLDNLNRTLYGFQKLHGLCEHDSRATRRNKTENKTEQLHSLFGQRGGSSRRGLNPLDEIVICVFETGERMMR